MTTARAALLLLADGRFPAGGHAHSGGVEVAAARGRVVDVHSLEAFLVGRLGTAGTVDAALAAATCARASALGAEAPWVELVAEADARVPSPALRAASRAQGGQLLRSARQAWPGPVLDALAGLGPAAVPSPVVLGATAAAAGCGPFDAAVVAAHQAVVGPASAAVRLLGLDPLGVAAVVAGLGPSVDAVAEAAAEGAERSLVELACPSGALLEIGAEDHASWEVRLFAS